SRASRTRACGSRRTRRSSCECVWSWLSPDENEAIGGRGRASTRREPWLVVVVATCLLLLLLHLARTLGARRRLVCRRAVAPGAEPTRHDVAERADLLDAPRMLRERSLIPDQIAGVGRGVCRRNRCHRKWHQRGEHLRDHVDDLSRRDGTRTF